MAINMIQNTPFVDRDWEVTLLPGGKFEATIKKAYSPSDHIMSGPTGSIFYATINIPAYPEIAKIVKDRRASSESGHGIRPATFSGMTMMLSAANPIAQSYSVSYLIKGDHI